MRKLIIDPNTTLTRGRPLVDSEQMGIRLSRELLNGIDAYTRDGPTGVPRTEAVRRILRDWLNAHGYLANPPVKEDTN